MENIGKNRAQFHAMTESTQEDWDLIGAELERFAKRLPDRLIAHLNLLRGDYGGFPVDRLEHCLQTATRAYQAAAMKSMWYALSCTISAIRLGLTTTRTSRPPSSSPLYRRRTTG